MITFVILVALLNVHVTLTPTLAVGEGVTVVVVGDAVLLDIVVVCVFDVLVVEGATVVLVVVEVVGSAVDEEVGSVVEELVGQMVEGVIVVVLVVCPETFPSLKDENMSKNAMKIFI
jgi:hypothetical protein